MATQQAFIAETVAAMKRALKRKAYESDSDESINHYGNRGHKLQKTARFSRRGQLAPSFGPQAYKEMIDYGGVRREIISRNPPLIDEEGYEVESDDEEERVQEAMAAAAELNPFAGIRIEHLLAPLTAITDLPNHPTLSKPFISRTLTQLVDQSGEFMRKENASLWKVRHLLTQLSGDYTWVPGGQMLGSNDLGLFSDEYVLRKLLHAGASSTVAAELEARSPATLNGESKSNHSVPLANGENGAHNGPKPTADPDAIDPDVTMEEVDSSEAPSPEVTKKKAPESKNTPRDAAIEKTSQSGSESSRTADSESKDNASTKASKLQGKERELAADSPVKQGEKSSATEATTAPEPAPEKNGIIRKVPSQSSDPSVDETFIHPFFLNPSQARPDRDAGLPEQEAEDIRRLLALYVQKQEEVCRGAKRLNAGLLRADQLRKTVLKWSKAEAHSGPNRDMSDGEDWYDKEEWGLTEELKKGQDEEEEDTAATQKKTRNRR